MYNVLDVVYDLDEVIRDAPHSDVHIQGSAALFYKCYLHTVLHNNNYWLSDIELLCLCACRRQSLVILKHEHCASSFFYHDSIEFEGSAPVFIKFSVQPGKNVVRTSFEKVKQGSYGNASSSQSSVEKKKPDAALQNPGAPRKRTHAGESKPDPAPPGFCTIFFESWQQKACASAI